MNHKLCCFSIFSTPSSSSLSVSLYITILIFFFFFSLLYKSVICSVDPHFTACESKTCGDDRNISFPFFITGLQESYCGYPGFDVSCDRTTGHPKINISNTLYIIQKIDYSNQSLRVSDAAVYSTLEARSSSACLPHTNNVTLPGDNRFSFAPEKTDLFLYYGCDASSLPQILLKYKVDQCSSSINSLKETDAVLALSGESGFNMSYVSENCKNGTMVKMPMERGFGKTRVSKESVVEKLEEGFWLKWIASNCSECAASGGRCGFDADSYHFQCYCHDRAHAKLCSTENTENTEKMKNTKDLVLGITLSFAGSVIIFSLGFTIWCCKRRYASPENTSKSDTDGGDMYFGVPVYSYVELEKATNHFDHTKEVGDGGFGTVYHGKLRDGREVAVKRLYEHNYRRIKQFINEVEILTRLRHKNLVTLYGCTSQRSRELLLVYEYIPNGTVADHLHGDRAKPGSLPWPIRINIAIETADALSYLHASDIVHRDVKTNNILLDNSFCVKVADFGLSRLFPNDVSHVSTAPQGTPGYVDPEYHECYQLTTKSDVYSFGVVLIELISSMPAVDIGRHRHEINLANLAINKIQKREYGELIDQSLCSENDGVKTMIISVAELAFQCLQLDKEMRPSMDEVLEALKRIQNGKGKATTMDEANVHTKISSNSLQPPQPSPDCDELGLLRRMKPMNSPIAVTDNWSSNLTTPNNSS